MVNNVVISRSCRRCNDAIEMRSTICESVAGKRQARTAIWAGARAAKLDTVNRILPTQATVYYRPSDCGYGIADQSREALMTARRQPPVRTFTRTHLFRGDLLKPRAWREIRR